MVRCRSSLLWFLALAHRPPAWLHRGTSLPASSLFPPCPCLARTVPVPHTQVPCVAVVENMSYFEADGKRYQPFGQGSGKRQGAPRRRACAVVLGAGVERRATRLLCCRSRALLRPCLTAAPLCCPSSHVLQLPRGRPRPGGVWPPQPGPLPCLHTEHRRVPSSPTAGDRIQAEFGIPNLVRFPIVPDLSAAGDSGRPVVVQDPAGPTAQAFLELGACVVREVRARRGGRRAARVLRLARAPALLAGARVPGSGAPAAAGLITPMPRVPRSVRGTTSIWLPSHYPRPLQPPCPPSTGGQAARGAQEQRALRPRAGRLCGAPARPGRRLPAGRRGAPGGAAGQQRWGCWSRRVGRAWPGRWLPAGRHGEALVRDWGSTGAGIRWPATGVHMPGRVVVGAARSNPTLRCLASHSLHVLHRNPTSASANLARPHPPAHRRWCAATTPLHHPNWPHQPTSPALASPAAGGAPQRHLRQVHQRVDGREDAAVSARPPTRAGRGGTQSGCCAAMWAAAGCARSGSACGPPARPAIPPPAPLAPRHPHPHLTPPSLALHLLPTAPRSDADIPDEIEPAGWQPVGNYAVQLTWPDGFSQVGGCAVEKGRPCAACEVLARRRTGGAELSRMPARSLTPPACLPLLPPTDRLVRAAGLAAAAERGGGGGAAAPARGGGGGGGRRQRRRRRHERGAADPGTGAAGARPRAVVRRRMQLSSSACVDVCMRLPAPE